MNIDTGKDSAGELNSVSIERKSSANHILAGLKDFLGDTKGEDAKPMRPYLDIPIRFIAVCWSIFQLLLPMPDFVLLNSDVVRAVHLAFALLLVYLYFPVVKKWRIKLGGHRLRNVSALIIDLILAVASVSTIMYLVLNYEAIAARAGMPSTMDMVAAGTLIVLLLEGTRRALGFPMACLGILFILYCRFAQNLPDFMAFRARSFEYIFSKLAIGSEGIFGVPLDVSATTIFLFVLFGAMLEKSGGGEYFVKLALSILGRYSGGPAKAAVLASGFTGMASGSSIANTVTTGTFTIPLMKRNGFPPEKAAAVEVAASTNGQLMPPVMGAAAFIIAEYCAMTYFEVLKAAIIPAVISYAALLYITHLEAKKLGIKGVPKSELPSFFATLVSGLHFMLPIAVLIYELVVLRHSPALSAFWAIVLLAILICIRTFYYTFVHEENHISQKRKVLHAAYRTLKLLYDSLASGALNMMAIGVAVAAAGIIVGSVTMGTGNKVAEIVETLSYGNVFLVLILAGIASLVLGMGLPTTATYIVMATLTAGIIVEFAGDYGLVIPVIAAHLFVFYFGILADDTPPVGLAAYAAAAIAKSPPIKTGIQGFIYDLRTAVIPFMFIFNINFLLYDYAADGSVVQMTGVFRMIWAFLTGLAAILLFTAAVQGYWLMKNKLHESVLLLVASIGIAVPALLASKINLPYSAIMIIACILIAIAAASQLFRKKRALAVNSASTAEKAHED